MQGKLHSGDMWTCLFGTQTYVYFLFVCFLFYDLPIDTPVPKPIRNECREIVYSILSMKCPHLLGSLKGSWIFINHVEKNLLMRLIMHIAWWKLYRVCSFQRFNGQFLQLKTSVRIHAQLKRLCHWQHGARISTMNTCAENRHCRQYIQCSLLQKFLHLSKNILLLNKTTGPEPPLSNWQRVWLEM